MSATATPPVHSAVTPPQVQPRLTNPTKPCWWATGLRAIPNLVVFSALAGVLYFGHHTGWKLPKFSELQGSSASVADDWCAEHLVPESLCIECQRDLLPKPEPIGFCREHGVAECVIDHPELAQVKEKPLAPKYDTVQAINLLPRPENNSRNTMHTSRVQFASADSIAKAGIDVDVVQERPMTDAFTANGELVFDPTRVAHLSARVPGTIVAVMKTVGDRVIAGETLALVDAAQVGQAKSHLLQAVVQLQLRKNTLQRMRAVAESGIVAARSIAEAESAVQEAEVSLITSRQGLQNLGFEVPEGLESKTSQALADDLRFLGLADPALLKLTAQKKTANLVPIISPFDGVLVVSDVVAGEVVDTSKSLMTVSDPSRLWLLLSVRQEDAPYVRVGLPVRFESDNGDQKVDGQISWISPAVDAQTRTLQVRVVVPNNSGSLRDKTFGTGRIILRQEPNAIVVPRDAVQTTADATFVFVRDKHYFEDGSPKFFHVRQVRMGARDGQYVELLAGVLPGEVIATRGSNVLLAQLLRSNLGAGCGCHDH
ncbi:MAG: efflux RND transporter periplasmic adaptor subunit [Planctomycetaceae bacterium]